MGKMFSTLTNIYEGREGAIFYFFVDILPISNIFNSFDKIKKKLPTTVSIGFYTHYIYCF